MTIRQSMIQTASKAGPILAESADLVADFILGKLNDDGGFAGRSSRSDLYYTVFALESLIALGREFPIDRVRDYVAGHDPASLDLVHLGCLVRCMKDLNMQIDTERVIDELMRYRSLDGGYNNIKNSPQATTYGCFIAAGVYQDLGVGIPDRQGIAQSLRSLMMDDGSYANDAEMKAGASPSTAAAITLNRYLGQEILPKSIDWLLARIHPNGGFTAIPGLPMADLLSTATVLHALLCASVNLENDDKEKCLDFIDMMWSGKGGFCGSLADGAVDCEYTFYGLMAIGHLS